MIENEKKIKSSKDPVNISITETILHQMKNCICQIKLKNERGTGFFCKIDLGNGEIMNCHMTNCHIIDDKYYNNYNNEEIYLLLNDEKTIKKIDLKIKKNFFPQGLGLNFN